MKIKTSIVLLSTIFTAVKAQQSNIGRYEQACGAFDYKLYCFGGILGNMSYDDPADSRMFLLDLTKDSTMSDLSNSWQLISPTTNGVNLEIRKYPQYATISDHQLLISGGFGGADNLTPLVDQTIVYDTKTNTWSKYSPYTEGPYGNRQIYFASTTLVPGKGVAFYGGFEQHINKNWTTNTQQNISAMTFNDGYSRVIGYTTVTYLDVTKSSNIWSQPVTTPPVLFSAFQSSVFNSLNQRIYYFGGTYQDTSLLSYAPLSYDNWHLFSYATYFDTATNTWGNQTLKGSIIPSVRRYHSTTIMPNDPTAMLLYGGEYIDTISTDFCYLLNLTTFTWTQQSFPVTPDGADLLRSRHSTLLLNNETLFIVFGFNSLSELTPKPIALNISSASSISYMSTYNYTGPVVSDDNNTTHSPHKSGLSTGAIAGIAVGAVAVIAIGLAVIFFRRRKDKDGDKKFSSQNHYIQTQYNPPNNQHTDEQVEVNWDEIEKQYSEILPSPQQQTYYNSSVARHSLDGITTVFSGSDESSKRVMSPDHQYELHSPNAFDDTKHQHFILKPDGAGH